jgi:hypothetical protein
VAIKVTSSHSKPIVLRSTLIWASHLHLDFFPWNSSSNIFHFLVFTSSATCSAHSDVFFITLGLLAEGNRFWSSLYVESAPCDVENKQFRKTVLNLTSKLQLVERIHATNFRYELLLSSHIQARVIWRVLSVSRRTVGLPFGFMTSYVLENVFQGK